MIMTMGRLVAAWKDTQTCGPTGLPVQQWSAARIGSGYQALPTSRPAIKESDDEPV